MMGKTALPKPSSPKPPSGYTVFVTIALLLPFALLFVGLYFGIINP
jgi:hypothetical protein